MATTDLRGLELTPWDSAFLSLCVASFQCYQTVKHVLEAEREPDWSLRRIIANIKTTPTKHLSDVLDEACKKLNLRPEQYGLKHNNKNLDVSLMLRYANLPPGANLHLVQASKSPSVVSVALQLPASEDNARLTDKFPSTTSFWQILRRFEAGAAGASSARHTNYNFTQRGVPHMSGQATGAGRLHYEMPVVQVMHRELSTFEDLQKSLAQIGLNSGSALLRISFKNSGKPLEEAMADISQYFRPSEVEEESAQAPTLGPSSSTADTPMSDKPMADAEKPTPAEDTPLPTQGTAPIEETKAPKAELSVDGLEDRSMTVFAAPGETSPDDPRFKFNAADYEPTVDHARLHQARLNTESRNRRLLSDAEIAANAKARDEKLAAVNGIRIRIRLPDQTMVESTFTQQDTASSLYGWIRPMLESENEPFVLRYPGTKGLPETLEDGPRKLVAGLGLKGSTLVTFSWDEQASVEARKKPILKEKYRQQAQQIKVEMPAASEEQGVNVKPLSGAQQQPKKSGGGGGDKEAKLKKFLGFGKSKK